ncbi:hypothetical protein [Pseudomonas aeruginosa]|uniref:hypothetical protein n=1 Tax=Pseudomonas aeruginosa TaxID=287 RepID=UPI000B1407B4|nr:hypothetical protein [Pseudomonas aeruginosa]
MPARLQRFAAGRALLLAVVAMLLWSVALLAVGGGLALLMILGLAPAGSCNAAWRSARGSWPRARTRA